jgi:hypothetical protein
VIISQEKALSTQKSSYSPAATLEIPKHLAEVSNMHYAALRPCQMQLIDSSHKFENKNLKLGDCAPCCSNHRNRKQPTTSNLQQTPAELDNVHPLRLRRQPAPRWAGDTGRLRARLRLRSGQGGQFLCYF